LSQKTGPFGWNWPAGAHLQCQGGNPGGLSRLLRHHRAQAGGRQVETERRAPADVHRLDERHGVPERRPAPLYRREQGRPASCWACREDILGKTDFDLRTRESARRWRKTDSNAWQPKEGFIETEDNYNGRTMRATKFRHRSRKRPRRTRHRDPGRDGQRPPKKPSGSRSGAFRTSLTSCPTPPLSSMPGKVHGLEPGHGGDHGCCGQRIWSARTTMNIHFVSTGNESPRSSTLFLNPTKRRERTIRA